MPVCRARGVFIRRVPGGAAGHGWGVASFSPLPASERQGSAPALHYREEGWWTQPDGSMHRIRGTYDYLYTLAPDDSLIAFRRRPDADVPVVPMYTLQIRSTGTAPQHDSWQARAQHVCPCSAAHLAGQADVYDALYVFCGPDTFARQIAVRGPEKHYVIHTAFARLSTLA